MHADILTFGLMLGFVVQFWASRTFAMPIDGAARSGVGIGALEVVFHSVAKKQLVTEYLFVAGQNGLPGHIAGGGVHAEGACTGRFHRWSDRHLARQTLVNCHRKALKCGDDGRRG